MKTVDLTGEPLAVQPLVIIFESDDGVIFNIHPQGYHYGCYGLLVCDLVSHIARAFGVEEDDVWEWVDRERKDPTAKVTPVS